MAVALWPLLCCNHINSLAVAVVAVVVAIAGVARQVRPPSRAHPLTGLWRPAVQPSACPSTDPAAGPSCTATGRRTDTCHMGCRGHRQQGLVDLAEDHQVVWHPRQRQDPRPLVPRQWAAPVRRPVASMAAAAAGVARLLSRGWFFLQKIIIARKLGYSNGHHHSIIVIDEYK